MFRVIILHEPVVRKFSSNEREKRCLQDVAVQISIHDTIKDTNLCGTMSANSRPDMNLQRMFWFWFLLCWLVYLPVTGAPILHEGNGTLVAENDVVKGIATFHDALSVLQSLHFVGVAYQLTVSSPL